MASLVAIYFSGAYIPVDNLEDKRMAEDLVRQYYYLVSS
jgi:hypothetical protein